MYVYIYIYIYIYIYPHICRSDEEDTGTSDGSSAEEERPEVYYLAQRELHLGHVPRAGRGVYYHRETVCRTRLGRDVELLTVTGARTTREYETSIQIDRT